MKQFNGIWFDEEIVTQYMQLQSCINPAILASGILQQDELLKASLGNAGNVGTIPYFLPIDGEEDAANYDGKTDNEPTELKTGKQTFMMISRMKSWKEVDFVRHLSGVSPLQNLADNLLVAYYELQWTRDLLATLKGIMGVSEMATHKSSAVYQADTNPYALVADLITKANGDRAGEYSLIVMHSVIANVLRKYDVIQNRKYTDPNTLKTWDIPYVGNMVVLEMDEGMSTGNKYKAYCVGKGAILTMDKVLPHAIELGRDPGKNGGQTSLFTKQAKVLHPNGFSIQIDQVAEESPTRAELGTTETWKLNVNQKYVNIAELEIQVG